MRHTPILIILAALLPAAHAAPAMTGAQVVEQQCFFCHGSGRDGAPRIGDVKAWEARTKAGLSALTRSALEGVRRMPPHGGKLTLTDHQIRLAITHMVNQSGGKWAEPVDRATRPAARSGESIVKARCNDCHATGKGGAPRVGDDKAWIGRAREGFDGLVRSAIAGHGGMPARGGMADLTDEEMRAAVAWMFQRSVKKE